MNTNQLAEELREALEEAGLLNYGPQSTPKARHIIKSAIEKAYCLGVDEMTKAGVEAVNESRAALASGQDESKAKRTARAIRSIAERAGLKITDDVELAWRDAILYALPAARASENS